MSEISDLKSTLKELDEQQLTYGMQKSLRSLKKEVDLYKKYVDQKDKSLEYVNTKEVDKLQIGSGLHKLDGWTNLDISFDADIYWDIREGLPFRDGSVETIFSEHTLEHIDYPRSVKLLYKEAHRVLKPGGTLITGIPDGGLAAQKYVEKDQRFFEMMLQRWYKNRKSLQHFNTYLDLVNYIFRDEDDDDTYTPHLWAYDEEKLKQLASEIGFANARKWDFDPTIANPKREWASVYVVCEKPVKE